MTTNQTSAAAEGKPDEQMGVNCPSCGVPITIDNAAGYRMYCENCIERATRVTNDVHSEIARIRRGDQIEVLKQKLESCEKALANAEAANKEMGDALEHLAKDARIQGNAGELCKAVAEELISLRARRPAIRALIDAIESCQDWRGTRVGDCIENLEAIL